MPPHDPTPEMLRAAKRAWQSLYQGAEGSDAEFIAVWQAMLDAAQRERTDDAVLSDGRHKTALLEVQQVVARWMDREPRPGVWNALADLHRRVCVALSNDGPVLNEASRGNEP